MNNQKKIDIREDQASFIKFYDEVLERKGTDAGIVIEADPITGKQVSALVDMDLLSAIYNEFYGTDEVVEMPQDKQELVKNILQAAKSLLDTPYVYAQSAVTGVDCSGFVKLAFGQAGVNLPHGSSTQATLGQEISLEEAREGDLLFFNTDTPKGTRVNHVGIVLNTGGKYNLDMIHASSGRKKVIIDSKVLKAGAYWDKALLFARRVI